LNCTNSCTPPAVLPCSPAQPPPTHPLNPHGLRQCFAEPEFWKHQFYLPTRFHKHFFRLDWLTDISLHAPVRGQCWRQRSLSSFRPREQRVHNLIKLSTNRLTRIISGGSVLFRFFTYT
jgi:hypothetical protein